MAEEPASDAPAARAHSLVDVAEDALRRWLATGPPPRRRAAAARAGAVGPAWGSRAARCAPRCERLEESGEIVRRQGSGTYVGRSRRRGRSTRGSRSSSPTASWRAAAACASRSPQLEIEQQPLGAEQGRLFELDPETPATTITRVLDIDGAAGRAHARRRAPRASTCPRPAKLRQALERGQMVLDVLLKQRRARGLQPLAHHGARADARATRSASRWASRRRPAALEIEHVTCTAEGAPVEHSTDTFLPHSLDLHVVRWLEDVPPVPAIERRSRELDQFDQCGYSRAASPSWIRTPTTPERA